MENEVILKAEDLHFYLPKQQGVVRAVNGVNLELRQGKILGVVGESGCGKSMMSLSLLQLMRDQGWQTEGEVYINDQEITSLSEKKLRRIRGREIALILQNPMSVFDSVRTIGDHLIDTISSHTEKTEQEARKIALESLKKVSLPQAAKIMKQYPFQLSGGMLQRAMIANAISLKPKILIADEPTTALDVTVQHQILGQLKRLVDEYQIGMLLISHDLGVIAQMADEVAVMYCGYIVEKAPVTQLFNKPSHPYTRGLLNSRVYLNQQKLNPIQGQPPSLLNLGSECPFRERCNEVKGYCSEYDLELLDVGEKHSVRCAKYLFEKKEYKYESVGSKEYKQSI